MEITISATITGSFDSAIPKGYGGTQTEGFGVPTEMT